MLPAGSIARGARRHPRLSRRRRTGGDRLRGHCLRQRQHGGDDFGRVREIEAEIRAFPQILECYSVSGEDDYLLKVVANDLKSLSTFLTDRLMQVPGIDDVRSMIALEEIKRASPLPIES